MPPAHPVWGQSNVADVLKQFRRRYIYPWFRPLLPYHQETFAGIRVSYKGHLDGGGRGFGQDFIPLLQHYGLSKQARAFEWCAGPGFVGFSLLGHGLCETLCLADINPEAVKACERTIADNGLAARVSVYCSDNLKSIPPAERWDLVVSNPPHFVDEYLGNLRAHDPDWRIHREFFRTVAAFLKPGGIIILQENNAGSTVDTFRRMIEESGLSIVFVEGALPFRTAAHQFYYIGIMRTGDAAPSWASALAKTPP
jgi:predicted RNA methylase